MAEYPTTETEIRAFLAQPKAELVLNRSDNSWWLKKGRQWSHVDQAAAQKLAGYLLQYDDRPTYAAWIL